MMPNMPRNNVSERPHGYRLPASHPTPPPRLVRQLPEQRQSLPPNIAKLLHMASPRTLIRPRRIHADILIETSQRFMKIAPKPQSAKRKRTFGVVQMAQRLPDTPLFRRIPVQ